MTNSFLACKQAVLRAYKHIFNIQESVFLLLLYTESIANLMWIGGELDMKSIWTRYELDEIVEIHRVHTEFIVALQ